MRKYLKYIICASIVIVLFFFDMITKILAVNLLEYREQIPILGEFLKLDLTFNPYAGFSLFKNAPAWFLPVMSAVMTVAFIFVIVKFADFKKKPIFTIALCLMLAGTAGNLVDRLTKFPSILYDGVIPTGEHATGVVDFINTSYIFEKVGLTFGIWNFADSFLVIGTIALVVHILFFDKSDKKEKNSKVEDEKKEESSEIIEVESEVIEVKENG